MNEQAYWSAVEEGKRAVDLGIDVCPHPEDSFENRAWWVGRAVRLEEEVKRLKKALYDREKHIPYAYR